MKSSIVEFIKSLNAPHFFERSIKFLDGSIASNRFLFSFSTNNMGFRPKYRLFKLGALLNMPEMFQGDIDHFIKGARFIHIGYEEDSGTETCKLYFEYADDHTPEPSAANENLLHIALKWNPQNVQEYATSRYVHQPDVTIKELEHEIASIYKASADSTLYQTSLSIVDLAKKQMGNEIPQLLLVNDSNTTRRSFDINLYDATLPLESISDQLTDIADYFNIPSHTIHEFTSQTQHKELGHIAGGLNRDNREFFTLYYGAQAR